MLGSRLRAFASLVLAQHNAQRLNSATLSAVTAAGKIGGGVHVLVAGHHTQAAAAHAASLQGVEKVLLFDSPQCAHPTNDQLSSLLNSVQSQGHYSHILAGASTFSKDVIPRLAGVLNVQPITDVVKILNPETFLRPMYAGSVFATVRSEAIVKVITIRATAFEKATLGGNAEIVSVQAELPSPLVTWVSEEVVKNDKPELTSARIVVTGGRAVKSKENWKMIEDLADAMGAAIGATRAAVDAQFCANELQVGQTGKVVAPDLYIALGVSGAIQHVAGMKDSKVIVSINTDPECPLMQISDYILVADIFKAVPELTQKVKSLKKAN